jgi:hypothetical protein
MFHVENSQNQLLSQIFGESTVQLKNPDVSQPITTEIAFPEESKSEENHFRENHLGACQKEPNVEDLMNDQILKKYESLLASRECADKDRLQDSITRLEAGLLKKIEEEAEKDQVVAKRYKELVHKNLRLFLLSQSCGMHQKMMQNSASTTALVSYEIKLIMNKYKAAGRLSENILRAEAKEDFSLDKFGSDERKVMLALKRGSSYWVLSAFSEEWLIISPEKGLDARIAPLKMLQFTKDALPKPKRPYDIKYWKSFGSSPDNFDEEGRMGGSSSCADIRSSSVLMRGFEIVHLLKDSTAIPKSVYVAKMLFNSPKQDEILIDEIPLLSFDRGDLISITKSPNKSGMAEGYLLNQRTLRLGVFPSSCCAPIIDLHH